MNCFMRKPALSLCMSDTNQTVQPQKMPRGVKFPTWEVVEWYYLCSETKGTDQLCSFHAADLHLCFHICKKADFLMMQFI